MFTKQELEYRSVHGVVPQLDRINEKDCLSLIPKTPVVHSKFATVGNVLKSADLGKVASGVGGAMMGMLQMGTGQFGHGLANVLKHSTRAATGAIDPEKTMSDVDVARILQQSEKIAWDRYHFLLDFVPAQGCLGDICLKDGSCDDFHCGNGYKIFDNGDYFEGLWEDGEIAWGVYIFQNGERYLGGFQNGEKHIHGLNIFGNGVYYDGEFLNGQMTGSGLIVYDKSAYCGEWHYGSRHGFGVSKFDDGTTFSGEWNHNEPVR